MAKPSSMSDETIFNQISQVFDSFFEFLIPFKIALGILVQVDMIEVKKLNKPTGGKPMSDETIFKMRN
ncbi:fibronectin-binding protein A [Streptococcus pneumoniae]|nr:fibronectin-binding protein A [Streptococcus pneumoniae]